MTVQTLQPDGSLVALTTEQKTAVRDGIGAQQSLADVAAATSAAISDEVAVLVSGAPKRFALGSFVLGTLSTVTAAAISATDTIKGALQKLQAQATANATALAGKQDRPAAFSTLATATLASSNDGGRYNPSATGNTYTIPTGLTGSDGAALNFGCMFSNPGTVIISPASGVTLNGGTVAITCTATATKKMVGVIQTAANTFTVLGA